MLFPYCPLMKAILLLSKAKGPQGTNQPNPWDFMFKAPPGMHEDWVHLLCPLLATVTKHNNGQIKANTAERRTFLLHCLPMYGNMCSTMLKIHTAQKLPKGNIMSVTGHEALWLSEVVAEVSFQTGILVSTIGGDDCVWMLVRSLSNQQHWWFLLLQQDAVHTHVPKVSTF